MKRAMAFARRNARELVRDPLTVGFSLGFPLVLLALLTIWIVITVTFFVMHSIPGGPFASEKAISAEAQAALPQSENRLLP